MLLFNSIMLILPVVFLIFSVVLAVKAFEKGKSRKRTVLMQLASFAAVFTLCMVCPLVAVRQQAMLLQPQMQLRQAWLTSAQVLQPAFLVSVAVLPLVTQLPQLSALQVRILRHSVRLSSSLHSVKVLHFTVCLSPSC